MGNKDSKKEIHLSQGTVIRGRYQIVDLIGRGGFCYTYKAFDSVLNVYVAIKEYFPHGVASRQSGNTVTVFTKADESMFYKGMRRFLNEARSLAQFNTNPSVVSVYDFFEENSTAYLVMEYLEGEDMKKHVGPAGNVLDLDYVKWLADYLCDTLAQIHEAGIVHRDISPDNIFICKDGNIKLIDFGAVKQSMNKNNESVTVILKQGYAPIEQYSSKGKLGPWTDIYALGATIYRLITGRVPPESVDRMVNDLLVPAHMLNPAVPKNFSFALMKAMSLTVEDRYHSMQEFKAGLNDTNSYPDVYYNQVLGDAYKIKPTESWETKALIEESSILQQDGFQDVSMEEGGYGDAGSGSLGYGGGAVPEVPGTYGTNVQGGYGNSGSGVLGSGPLNYDDSGALGSGPLGYDDSGALGSGPLGYDDSGALGSGPLGYSGGSGARDNDGRAVPEVPGTYGTGRNKLLIPLIAACAALVILITVLVTQAVLKSNGSEKGASASAVTDTSSGDTAEAELATVAENPRANEVPESDVTAELTAESTNTEVNETGPVRKNGELIKVGIINTDPNESGYRMANDQDLKAMFTQVNGYEASFAYSLRNDDQISAAYKFIQDGCEYLFISAADTSGWDSVLQEAKDKGIKVILFDREIDVDPSLYDALIILDLKAEGEKAAKWLKDQGLSEYKIVHLQGVMGSEAQQGRSEPLEEYAKENGWTIVTQQTAEWNAERAQQIVKALIDSGEKFNVIYAENDDMAKGAVAELDKANISHGVGKDVLIVSFDCNKWALSELLNQNWNYDVQCSPFQAEYIDQVVRQLESGATLPVKTIIVEDKGFDATTIKQEDIDKYGL